ncbi:MAG: hypothetical protein ACYTG0_43335 [Planctomycetota bacterium]|jgi:hypothetical protein
METTSLPLERVVLFNSGVGYFEHAGSVEGDCRVELKFNVDDVNDLLKSMVVQDFGGGRVSTVSYGSKDPIHKTLKTFAVDLTTKPTFAQLLDQVRGERIEVEAAEKTTGVIVGVETRKRKTDKNEIVTTDVLNLLTDQGLQAVSLEGVSGIRLVNEKLDAELRQALDVLATAHSLDKKTVAIHFLGQGERPVRVGYIRETPVWKTSYRLVLDDEKPPFLQGWAIVENTTEQDWDGVSLTLVSGRPISFVMDLYEPLYLKRPAVEMEKHESLRPQAHDQDLAAEEKLLKLSRVRSAEPKGGTMAAAPPGYVGTGAPEAEAEEGKLYHSIFGRVEEDLGLQQGVESMAVAGEVGELFQYSIDMPVSLSRRQSAMLPIVNAPVEGERLSVYNENVHVKHPLVGLRLTNTTGLHLMQGPITVFDGSVYAGDARTADLPPDSDRLVSYALDLDVEVAPEHDPAVRGAGPSVPRSETILSVRLVKGQLQETRKRTLTHKYAVKNSGSVAKTVLIECPYSSPWKLVTPAEPAEKTRDRYRFAVEAEPNRPTTLVVGEEMTVSHRFALMQGKGLTTDLAVYLESREVSDEVKEVLAEIIRRQKEFSDRTVQRLRQEKRIETIVKEQDRIRQNMAPLDQASELYRRYVKKFNDQEDQIERLRDQIGRLTDEQAQFRKSLEDYLERLDVT